MNEDSQVKKDKLEETPKVPVEITVPKENTDNPVGIQVIAQLDKKQIIIEFAKPIRWCGFRLEGAKLFRDILSAKIDILESGKLPDAEKEETSSPSTDTPKPADS